MLEQVPLKPHGVARRQFVDRVDVASVLDYEHYVPQITRIHRQRICISVYEDSTGRELFVEAFSRLTAAHLAARKTLFDKRDRFARG